MSGPAASADTQQKTAKLPAVSGNIDLLEQFSLKLLAIAATVKQATSDNRTTNILHESRCRLLHHIQHFASTEGKALQSSAARHCEDRTGILNASALVQNLKADVGNERRWRRESAQALADRLSKMFEHLKVFPSYMENVTPKSAKAVVALYSELKDRGSPTAGSSLQAPPSRKRSLSHSADCVTTPGLVLSPLEPNSCSGHVSTAPAKRRRAYSSFGSTPATERPSPMQQGPDWATIFDLVDRDLVPKLSARSLGCVRLVCSAWRRCVDGMQSKISVIHSIPKMDRLVKIFPNVTSLDLESALGQQPPPDSLWTLGQGRGKQLQTLRLSHCAIDCIHLPFFVMFQSLTKLDLSRCALLTAKKLEALPQFLPPSLTSLSLAHCDMSDKALRKLGDIGVPSPTGQLLHRPTAAALPGKLPDTINPEASVPQLRLEELDLTGCRNITDHGMLLFTDRPTASQLRVMRLSNCSHLTFATIQVLPQRLPDLKEIDLSGLNELDDTHLKALGSLTNLEVLSVGSSLATGDFLVCLGELPHLRTLSLQGCNRLTDQAMKHYFPEPTLRTPVLQHLSSVDMAFCGKAGGPETWRKMSMIPSLTHLDVSYSMTTTSAIGSWMAKMTALHSLSLEGCNSVSERALDSFITHPSLKSINMRGCTSLGHYGILALESRGVQLAR